jgi:hypothetical protein
MSQLPQITVQGYPVRTNGLSHIPRRAQGIQALALWKSENPTAPDYWLRQEIGMAFQQMICLALDGAPAAEMLPLTAEMWVMTIGFGMVEVLDRERVRDGFRQLYRKLKKWPQPVELSDVLPGRPKRSALAEPAISEVDHAEQSRKLQEIMNMLNKGDDHGMQS